MAQATATARLVVVAGSLLLIYRLLSQRRVDAPPEEEGADPKENVANTNANDDTSDDTPTPLQMAAVARLSKSQGRWNRFRARVSTERRLIFSPTLLEACNAMNEAASEKLPELSVSESLLTLSDAWHTSPEHIVRAIEARDWLCEMGKRDPELAPVVALSHWVRYRDFVDQNIDGRTDLWHRFAFRRLLALPKVPHSPRPPRACAHVPPLPLRLSARLALRPRHGTCSRRLRRPSRCTTSREATWLT